jgi:hypothetical protein
VSFAGLLLTAVAWGQDDELPSRSVYERPAVRRSAANSNRRKGYLDRVKSGSTPAAPALESRSRAPGRLNVEPNTRLAQIEARGGRPQAVAGQAVVPAFFPAPVGGKAAEVAPAAEPPLGPPPELLSGSKGEHPLLPAVRWAKQSKERIDQLHDYSATLVKRERIGSELHDHEYLFVKVRHEPFSIYVRFLGPKDVKGQEAIFVKGKNDDKLVAHGTGAKKIFGTLHLDPNSAMAKHNNRYPITELGLRRLTERLIEVGSHDAQFGECNVQVKAHAKIDKRDCTLIEVEHPVPRDEFLFHRARIYVDSVYDMPVRYEAYEWPAEPGGAPVLTEEYTYLNLKFNNAFGDKDFDPENPEYGYRK